MDGFLKTGCKTRKIFPFDPECTTYMYLTLGRALFLQKKKEKEMQWKVSEKSSFHFWSANALIAFVTNVEYQDGKKNPKEKLNGSLRVEKQKKSFIFIFLNYCRIVIFIIFVIEYKSLPIFSKIFCTNNKKWGCISQLTQCGGQNLKFCINLIVVFFYCKNRTIIIIFSLVNTIHCCWV